MKKPIVAVLSIVTLGALLLLFLLKENNPSATIAFLESLDNQQLEKVNLALEDSSRHNWHYLPGKMWPRAGIQLHELNDKQKKVFSTMLRNSLSETGYNKTQHIIGLENVLAKIEGNSDFRDPERYFIAVYGSPKSDSLWSWSFEGHHISLNFTILNDKITTTPRFFGAYPAIIQDGDRKGEKTLHQEEDLAYAFMNELTEQQKNKAIFKNESFTDIITSNESEVDPLNPVGIKANELNADQKLNLKVLISEYLNSLPEELALDRKNKIYQEEFDEIRFGWAGTLTKGDAHYYRIQGKTFLIEFDNTQNNANHIHTVWRDFDGDFGRDLIKEHYLRAKHHKGD